MNVHDKIDEIAPEFVTGRLDAETARHVELHLATCADCAALTGTAVDLAAQAASERLLLMATATSLGLAPKAQGTEQ